jgi:hypothetical protein
VEELETFLEEHANGIILGESQCIRVTFWYLARTNEAAPDEIKSLRRYKEYDNQCIDPGNVFTRPFFTVRFLDSFQESSNRLVPAFLLILGHDEANEAAGKSHP